VGQTRDAIEGQTLILKVSGKRFKERISNQNVNHAKDTAADIHEFSVSWEDRSQKIMHFEFGKMMD